MVKEIADLIREGYGFGLFCALCVVCGAITELFRITIKIKKQ